MMISRPSCYDLAAVRARRASLKIEAEADANAKEIEGLIQSTVTGFDGLPPHVDGDEALAVTSPPAYKSQVALRPLIVHLPSAPTMAVPPI